MCSSHSRKGLGLGIVVCALTLGAASHSRADFLLTSDLSDEILRFSDAGGARGAFVTAGSGGLNSPQAIAWGPDGNLYVAGAGHIKAYNGTTGAFIGTPYIPPAGELFGLLFTPNGDMLISQNKSVIRVSPGIPSVTTTNIPVGDSPGKMILAPDGNVLIGVDTGGVGAIRKINLSNNAVSDFATGGGLRGPFGFDYGPDGKLYSANIYGDYGIYRIDPQSGQVLGKFTDSGLTAASDVLFVPGNRMWVSAVLTNELNRFDATTGEFINNVPGGSFNWDMLYVPEPGALAVMGPFAACLLRRRRLGR